VRTDPALTASTPGIILSSRVISTDIPILFFWASRCLPTFSDCREINGDRTRSCKFHSKQIVDRNQALITSFLEGGGTVRSMSGGLNRSAQHFILKGRWSDLEGEMECGLMGHRFHRGFTAAEKTELWDRWKRGESLKAIGRAFGKQSSSIYFLVAPHPPIGPDN
jgi:hypothetical protein